MQLLQAGAIEVRKTARFGERMTMRFVFEHHTLAIEEAVSSESAGLVVALVYLDLSKCTSQARPGMAHLLDSSPATHARKVQSSGSTGEVPQEQGAQAKSDVCTLSEQKFMPQVRVCICVCICMYVYIYTMV